MGKLAGILAVISAFGAKLWRIIKAVSKLNTLKKEVIEAYIESKQAYDCAMRTIEIIQGYFKPESDGGKKLTINEITAITEQIKVLSIEIKQAATESMEAKNEIKKIIETVKKK